MKAGLGARLSLTLMACALAHCANGNPQTGASGEDAGGSSGGSDAAFADDTTTGGPGADASSGADAYSDAPRGDSTSDATAEAAADAMAGGDASADATVPSDATTPDDAQADASPSDGAVQGSDATPDAQSPPDAAPDATADGASTGDAGADAGDTGARADAGDASAGADAADAGDAGGPAPDAGPDATCAVDTQFPQTTFVNLAVTLGAALNPSENDAIPGDAGASSPAGWNYYAIGGALCRDGSPAGFYVHLGSATKLFVYLEGGGACSSATFCSHNPANIGSSFVGGAQTQGQTIGGSLAAFSTTPQEPYVPIPASGTTPAYSPGIFDFSNAANPFKDWNAVYIPYCTGDVHFGTIDNGTIPGDGVLPALNNQHFVGYRNMQKFVARIVPTFPNVTQVLLTGASAGGFGAGLNYGMVQDSFGAIPVVLLDDSGPPFSVQYIPACLQQQWRTTWGFDAALPSDCAECSNSDGSGLTNVVQYWRHKYARAKVGLVSTMQDEVMRLFFASGDNSCASNNATLLDGEQLLGGYTGAEYTQGLDDLVATFQCTGALAAYLIGGQNPSYPNPTYHQHIFRNEFYQAITNDGGVTMAQWASDLVNGNLEIVGP